MTILFDDFLPEIMPEVAGCPEAVAINAVRNTCVEFCQGTDIWPNVLTIPVIANASLVALTPPPGTDISNVLVTLFDNRVIRVESEEDLDKCYPGWRVATSIQPTVFVVDRASTPISLRLYPIPTVAGTITVSVSLKPSPSSTGVGDIIYRDYHRAIAFGAKSELMGMFGMPWANDIAAMRHTDKFRSAMTDARISVIKGHSKKSLHLEYVPFI